MKKQKLERLRNLRQKLSCQQLSKYTQPLGYEMHGDTLLPVLPAYAVELSLNDPNWHITPENCWLLKVWCSKCEVWHTHGGDADALNGTGDGYREAHCITNFPERNYVPKTPGAYILKCVGRFTPAIKRIHKERDGRRAREWMTFILELKSQLFEQSYIFRRMENILSDIESGRLAVEAAKTERSQRARQRDVNKAEVRLRKEIARFGAFADSLEFILNNDDESAKPRSKHSQRITSRLAHINLDLALLHRLLAKAEQESRATARLRKAIQRHEVRVQQLKNQLTDEK